MRPLKLEMTAFGPYAEKTLIDMDRLGKEGIYLVTGNTGAGKTSIFDGISFALYGQPSGRLRSAASLRSQYAKADTLTEVSLEFEHMGEKYKITRRPEQERPNKRGAGNVKDGATAEYYPPGRSPLTRLSEVNKAIEELLGIDREQFCQIAMISQGEFRELLTADTKKRMEIFRKLFNTEIYSRLQDRLTAELAVVRKEFSETEQSLKQYIGDAKADESTIMAVELRKAREEGGSHSDTIEVINKILNADKEKKYVQDTAISEANVECGRLEQIIGKAAEFRKSEKNLEEAVGQMKRKEQERGRIEKELKFLEKREPEARELAERAARLETQLPRYEEHSAVTKLIEQNQTDSRRCRESIQEKERVEKECNDRAVRLRKEKSELGDPALMEAKLMAERSDVLAEKMGMSELEAAFEKISTLEGEYSTRLKEYGAARDSSVTAGTEYDKMNRRFLDAQAGILASGLKGGEACPVCGSTEHPDPAKTAEDAPSEEELKRAKKTAKKAASLMEERSLSSREAKVKLDNIKDEIIRRARQAGETDDEGLRERVNQVIRKAEDRIGELDVKINGEKRKQKRLQDISETIEKEDKMLTELKSEITSARSDAAVLDEKNKSLMGKRDDIASGLDYENAGQLKEEISRLRREEKRITEDLSSARKKFADSERDLGLLKGRCAELREIVSRGCDVDDKDAKENLETVRKKIDGLQESQREIHSRIEINDRVIKNIQQGAGRMSQVEEKLRWMETLTATACGNLRGCRKLTLETYVQTAYFDRIIHKANIRFRIMSDNQYEFKRQIEADRLQGKTGLELNVIDHYNGSERSVKTLSGGESFMASLSLALGLSDEIQATAGGIRLDTMFVDEGFGSLDEESLSQAMKALSKIAENDRLIGLISHVTELKDKIDRQIVVKKMKSGGSIVELIAE